MRAWRGGCAPLPPPSAACWRVSPGGHRCCIRRVGTARGGAGTQEQERSRMQAGRRQGAGEEQAGSREQAGCRKQDAGSREQAEVQEWPGPALGWPRATTQHSHLTGEHTERGPCLTPAPSAPSWDWDPIHHSPPSIPAMQKAPIYSKFYLQFYYKCHWCHTGDPKSSCPPPARAQGCPGASPSEDPPTPSSWAGQEPPCTPSPHGRARLSPWTP